MVLPAAHGSTVSPVLCHHGRTELPSVFIVHLGNVHEMLAGELGELEREWASQHGDIVRLQAPFNVRSTRASRNDLTNEIAM